ncbi:MAG TPA: GNAT family N-acetyltransferase [Rhizomicrobium sp.]|nr:GNAT family N-acetyltransferase [Rhizomicrobium sp.]
MAEIIAHPKASESVLAAPAPISDKHDLSSFDCGKAPLDDWLKYRALRSEGRSARAYVVAHGKVVIGYYCLAGGAVIAKDAPGKIRRNMPNPIPVMIIGRLAVDKLYQGQGIGPAMLKDALQRILGVSKAVGARAVMVHAIDNDALAFYAAYGFKPFPLDSRTMCLPIEDIVAAIA